MQNKVNSLMTVGAELGRIINVYADEKTVRICGETEEHKFFVLEWTEQDVTEGINAQI